MHALSKVCSKQVSIWSSDKVKKYVNVNLGHILSNTTRQIGNEAVLNGDHKN